MNGYALSSSGRLRLAEVQMTDCVCGTVLTQHCVSHPASLNPGRVQDFTGDAVMWQHRTQSLSRGVLGSMRINGLQMLDHMSDLSFIRHALQYCSVPIGLCHKMLSILAQAEAPIIHSN